MSATNTTPKPPLDAVSSQSPAPRTAKLFKNGRSQAVRLPKEFRFEGTEVAIRRDPATGEVRLTPRVKRREEPVGETPAVAEPLQAEPAQTGTNAARKLSLPELYAIFDQADFPDDFFEREVHMPRELDLL